VLKGSGKLNLPVVAVAVVAAVVVVVVAAFGNEITHGFE